MIINCTTKLLKYVKFKSSANKGVKLIVLSQLNCSYLILPKLNCQALFWTFFTIFTKCHLKQIITDKTKQNTQNGPYANLRNRMPFHYSHLARSFIMIRLGNDI